MILDKPIVIVDIETTGMSSHRNRITEIGMIKTDGEKILGEYATLINPGMLIPRNITLLTGISNSAVSMAPFFEEIAEKIHTFMNGCYFMAHNVSFDFSFLKRQLTDLGYDFQPRLLCSVKLSRALYPHVKGHSLGKIISRHGLTVGARHRALDDASAVFQFIESAKNEQGISRLTDALKKQLKYKSLPSYLDDSHLIDVKNKPGVYLFRDALGTAVYVGKSVNIRNRVLSHFSQASSVAKELKINLNTHKVETIYTDSEVEALLLESKLVKELSPIYNRRLRRNKALFLLTSSFDEHGYKTLSISSGVFGEDSNLTEIFGVFQTKKRALIAVEEIRNKFKLCNKLVGLETKKGPCFMYQLKRCSGACVNAEDVNIYNLKVASALTGRQYTEWPYDGPINLKASATSNLLLNNWQVVGKYLNDNDLDDSVKSEFNIDNYKIIRSALSKYPENINRL